MKKSEEADKEQKLNKLISSFQKVTDRGISTLNGIIGDYLQNQKNDLSIKMKFYLCGKPLQLNQKSLTTKYSTLKSKISIFIHGVCDDESTWNFMGDSQNNYGLLLEKDFGYTPFFLRYNSGLHISKNGQNFSEIISDLLRVYPAAIQEIVIIAHSMGGLVTRSACNYATENNAAWVSKLKKVFFLGSPHQGAPLEKFGNILTNILKVIPLSYTKLAGDVINLRSSGIKDMRYGYVTDEDWEGKDADALLENNKNPIPLLKDVSYYVITGTVTKNPKSPVAQWFGDSMVRKSSALGKSKNEELSISFHMENHKEFPGINHLKLTYMPCVYEQIKIWIGKE